MATKKITITVPEELLESIRSRVDARGVSAYITEAAVRMDAFDKLGELSTLLEEEYGPYEDEAYDAVLDRIAAIDTWHDERRAQAAQPVQGTEEGHGLPQEQAA